MRALRQFVSILAIGMLSACSEAASAPEGSQSEHVDRDLFMGTLLTISGTPVRPELSSSETRDARLAGRINIWVTKGGVEVQSGCGFGAVQADGVIKQLRDLSPSNRTCSSKDIEYLAQLRTMVADGGKLTGLDGSILTLTSASGQTATFERDPFAIVD
ncbi:hypothetical protein D3C72_1684450 [compost metagenome]